MSYDIKIQIRDIFKSQHPQLVKLATIAYKTLIEKNKIN